MNLNGTYRGFSPTDESDAGVGGELEVVIDDDTIVFRHATGLEIESRSMPRSEFHQLSSREVESLFYEDANLVGIEFYRVGAEGPIFVYMGGYLEIPADTPHVMVLRFVSEVIDEIFGPTILFTPAQVTAGFFDQCVESVEAQEGDPGVIPRLANNGQRLSPSKA